MPLEWAMGPAGLARIAELRNPPIVSVERVIFAMTRHSAPALELQTRKNRDRFSVTDFKEKEQT
jgi:hypothetical protein